MEHGVNKYIHLKRGDKASIEQMMKDAEEALTGGNSSTSSRRHAFRNRHREAVQARRLHPRKKLGLSILPIVITGTKNALAQHSVNFTASTRYACDLDEIPAHGREDEPRKAHRALTRRYHGRAENARG
jgi:1-acyl-sn-glycerol-3-phosphate acyltransferase